MNMNEKLRVAANEFAEKARKLSTVLEIDIVGSVAGGDPYPNDLDLAVVISSFDEIETLAKYARQISAYYHSWDVFLFDENFTPLDRICYRKNCPTNSIDCAVESCGKHPHVMVIPGFKFDEKEFLTSPIETLWTSFDKSILLSYKEKLGITKTKEYPILKDIKIKCIICGKTFLFTAMEQKIYQKRGFKQPKRCPDCKMRILMDEFGYD